MTTETASVTVTAPVPISQFLDPPRKSDGYAPFIIVMGRRETGKTMFAVRMVEEFVKRYAERKDEAHVQVCVPENPYGKASERFAAAGCAPTEFTFNNSACGRFACGDLMYAADCKCKRTKNKELRAAVSECRKKSREGKRTLFVIDHCFNDLTHEIAVELLRLPGDTVKVITMTYPSIVGFFPYPFGLVYLDRNSHETYIARTLERTGVWRPAFLTVQRELAKENILPAVLPEYASDDSHAGFRFVGVSEEELLRGNPGSPSPPPGLRRGMRGRHANLYMGGASRGARGRHAP